MARVLWRDAQGKEGSLELGGGEIQIGRAVECAIRTDDGMVSRHHARLYWGGGQYYLEDLGSANGVFYQEQRVTRHLLKHGDAIRCGSLWLRFVDASASAPVQPDQQPMIGAGAVPAQAAYPTAGTGPYQGTPQQPPSYPPSAPVPAHVPPPASGPGSAPEGAMTGGSGPQGPQGADVDRLQRRIEQLETELRLYRRGRGEEVAKRIEELDERNAALREEREELKERVRHLEATLEIEGSDARSVRAGELMSKTSELVQQLNDILSNLRINVMAAEGEFEQFSHQLPRASFELIRESLRSSSSDVDTARDLLRALRDLA
ncbi:MAG: hypothetical protein Tsb0020_42700 [Haliangiales bacterium]